MTRKLRAIFDGKVLVPQGPVDLPTGQIVELRVDIAREPGSEEARDAAGEDPQPTPQVAEWSQALLRFIESLPPIDRGDLPTDGSINYKHYLYGHPKQPGPSQS